MNGSSKLQVGEFSIHERIGRGGSAQVYSAFQPSVNRFVALKMINLHSDMRADNDQFIRRFTQEAQVLASLEHPHIVPIYSFGIVENEFAYIAMRLMHRSLRDILQGSPLPEQNAIEIMLQLTSGLSYAHRKGVIHRDIKPGNVLFDETGAACLGDFGLAKMNDASMAMSDPGTLVGTALYVSPEQVRGTNVDYRTDIYSLGVILYELLTGRLPFDARNLNLMSALYKVEYEEPIPPRKINPEISLEVERIIMQALRKESRERFSDVREMADALGGLNIEPSRRYYSWVHRATSSVPLREQRSYAGLLVGTALLLLLLLILLIGGSTYFTATQLTPTIIANAYGTPDDAIPSSEEITRAQARLGENGFIAYIACELDSQTQATRAREMRDYADNYEVAYRVYNSESDAYKQLTLIERARLEGAQALIICPLDPSLLRESLQSIQATRMPLVLTSALSRHYGGVMLDANDAELGRLAGDYVANLLEGREIVAPRVAILDAPQFSYSEARVQGFLDALTARLPQAQVIARMPASARRDDSQDTIQELLAAQQQPDVIFSVTDNGAYGAASALDAAGVDNSNVVIASINAESAALDYIYNDYFLTLSVDDAREAGSRAALNAAVKLLGGGTIPEILNLPSGIVITRDIIEESTPDK